MALYNKIDPPKKTTPLSRKVDPLIAINREYIQSPEYKKRLIKQGVENPDKVIKQRLDKLSQVQTSGTSSPHMSYIYTRPDQKEPIPSLGVSPDASDYETMHEISHVTNYGETFYDPKKYKASEGWRIGDEGTASGKAMSQKEMKFLISKSNLPDGVKKNIFGRMDQAKGSGRYENPTEGMSGEAHSFNPSEFKADLDAVRLLLKKHGIVKKFGEDITEKTLEKAMKNPKIANEEHFIRMLKNFNKKNFVEVNNSIAKVRTSGEDIA